MESLYQAIQRVKKKNKKTSEIQKKIKRHQKSKIEANSIFTHVFGPGVCFVFRVCKCIHKSYNCVSLCEHMNPHMFCLSFGFGS